MDIQFFGIFLGKLEALAIQLLGNGVGILVVVAVFGGRHNQLTNGFFAFKVSFHGVNQFIHRDALIFIDKFLDNCQRVNNCAVTHEFEVAEINTAIDVRLVNISQIFHAQIMQG